MSLTWLADTRLSQDRATPIRFCRPTGSWGTEAVPNRGLTVHCQCPLPRDSPAMLTRSPASLKPTGRSDFVPGGPGGVPAHSDQSSNYGARLIWPSCEPSWRLSRLRPRRERAGRSTLRSCHRRFSSDFAFARHLARNYTRKGWVEGGSVPAVECLPIEQLGEPMGKRGKPRLVLIERTSEPTPSIPEKRWRECVGVEPTQDCDAAPNGFEVRSRSSRRVPCRVVS